MQNQNNALQAVQSTAKSKAHDTERITVPNPTRPTGNQSTPDSRATNTVKKVRTPSADPSVHDLRVTRREALLLILSGLFITVSYLGLIFAQPAILSIVDLWRVGVWVICALVGHRVLSIRLPHRDPFLFPGAMLLSGWGLVLISRLAPEFDERQTVWLIVAASGLILTISAPLALNWMARYRYLWLISGLSLLFFTIVAGSNPSGFGPRLWLSFLNLYFQPSESLKIILVGFLASYLADYHPFLESHMIQVGRWRVPSPAFLAPLLIMWGFSIVLLLWQQDLGAATLFFIVFVTMLYVSTGERMYVVGGGGLLLIAGTVAYFAFRVVRLRIDIWINPFLDPNNRAFQIVQSLLAFSSGGLFGQGIGQGSPTYIPVVHSDFILAAVGEEWGLLGTYAVVGLIVLLVMRGFRIAARQTQPFRAYLAAGLSIMLAAQSLLIMGGVIKLIPLTGVTLPFISYGGSSLLVSFIALGFLLILSATTEEPHQ